MVVLQVTSLFDSHVIGHSTADTTADLLMRRSALDRPTFHTRYHGHAEANRRLAAITCWAGFVLTAAWLLWQLNGGLHWVAGVASRGLPCASRMGCVVPESPIQKIAQAQRNYRGLGYERRCLGGLRGCSSGQHCLGRCCSCSTNGISSQHRVLLASAQGRAGLVSTTCACWRGVRAARRVTAVKRVCMLKSPVGSLMIANSEPS